MKTKLLTPALIALICMGAALSAAFTACDNGTKSTTETPETKPGTPTTPTTLAPTTVSFVTLGTLPGTTINFAPSAALPAGVTYTVKDNRPTPNTWNSANSFTGVVNVSTYNGLSDTNVTFTQTFYLNGTKITGAGSERTVVVNVDDFPSLRFMNTVSDTGSVTLQYPPPQLSKTITVPAITFTPGATFSFTQSITGWDADFPASDVTYTVTLTKNSSAVYTFESTSATSISASGRADGIYTLTQTFKYKGNTITGGSRSVGIEIDTNTFSDMYVSETNYAAGSFAALTLNLSK